MDREILLSGVSDDWLDLLDVELDPIISQITRPTPEPAKIFEFARLTELSNIKVVILGQDPYPKAGEAHGLAFSCLIGVPASLKNIYKCLDITMKRVPNTLESGDLTSWAQQGVLLLNCALTTEIGKSNAHYKYWKSYTDRLIKTISELRPIVFMLWGNFAKEKAGLLHKQSHILTWTHPSPLAGNRFIECNHFVKSNQILKKLGHLPIIWCEPTHVEQKIPSDVVQRFNNATVAFVDGSANPNKTSPAAIGAYAANFVLGPFQDVVLYGNIKRDVYYANNQRAEGTAILKVLEYLLKHCIKWQEAVIVSDSEFWIKMFTIYMPAWDRAGLDFATKKNPDLTKLMYKLYNELIAMDKTIEFRHIRSHNKNGWKSKSLDSYEYFCYEQNDYVDQLAKYARLNLKANEHIESIAEYDN